MHDLHVFLLDNYLPNPTSNDLHTWASIPWNASGRAFVCCPLPQSLYRERAFNAGALPQANADPSSKQASFEKQENEDSSSQTCSRRKMKRKPKLKGTKKSQAGVVVRQGPNPEQVQAAQPSLRFTEVCVEQSGLPRLEHLDSVRPGWWGEATFSSAGCLDGIQTEQSNLRDQGFTEDTQANIYNEAQTKKTAGKQGLGIGSGGTQIFRLHY